MKKPKTTPCIYIGRRLYREDQVAHAFLVPGEKDPSLFKRAPRGVYIGGTFALEKGGHSCPRRPERVVDAPEPKHRDLIAWEAQDLVAHKVCSEKRFKERMRKDKRLLKVVPELMALCETVPADQVAVFVRALSELCWREAHRRK